MAVTKYNDDKLFDVWSRSMSDKPFLEWKKSLEIKAEQKQRGESAITGADLARM